MLAALSLDFGGTLALEQPRRHEVYAEEARRVGLELDPEDIATRMAAAHQQLPQEIGGAFRYTPRWFEHFIPAVLPLEELDPSAGELLRSRLLERFADPALYALLPGAREVLGAAEQLGLPLALISNWGPSLPRTLEFLGIAERFGVVLVSALEGLEKPDPRLFSRACAGLGVNPSTVLHVGDHPRKDGAGALNAGMMAAVIDPSGTMDLPAGAHRLRDLRQLPELLAELTAG